MNPDSANSYDLPSSELIQRARLGDAMAFGDLVRLHHARAYRTALRILRNPEDAEDAVQDATISAYRNLEKFRGDSAYGTWFTRIVMNVSLMQLRKKNRRHYISLEEPLGEELPLAEVLASGMSSPEDVFLEDQRLGLLWRWLGELPASLRDITAERIREELSVDELAARRGISVAAAKSRLLRARYAIVERASSGQNPVEHRNLSSA